MFSRLLSKTTAPRTALLRTFAEGKVEVASGATTTDGSVTQYIDGQLVKRTTLTLKKTEDIESFVIQLFRNYFRTTNRAALAIDSTLEQHGLDSLDSIELSMEIEEQLGYVISAETLPVLQSVRHYVNYIRQVEDFKERTKTSPLA